METPEEKIVVLLHDVVEDSDITIQHLKENGFSLKILKAIALLTKTITRNMKNTLLQSKKIY